MKYLIVILSLFLISCTTTLPEMSSEIKYQRDLRFDVEYWDPKKEKWRGDQSFVGVGVLKDAPAYKVTIHAIGKVDMMTLHSCHREIKTPNPEKSSWFSSKKYTFKFKADDMIEKNNACTLNAGIYEKEKGRHGWAMAAIQRSSASLKATMRCNGDVIKSGGTSFCQAKEGLIQRLEFDRPVETTFYTGCALKKPKDGKTWEYLMPRGKCVLSFFDKDLNEHVHYMFGYDTIPIRGIE